VSRARFLILLSIPLLPALAIAQGAPGTAAGTSAPSVSTSVAGSSPATASPDFAASLVQMLFGLAVVIALLFACLWLIRRLAAPRGGATVIKVLGAAAVGPRERVVLVQLGEQVLVLGVAPGSVNKLHEMNRNELPLPTSAGADQAGPNFSGWLKQAMERRNAR